MDTNNMTAEQALEAAKGLTFEKVWAALMETKAQMQEETNQMKKKMDETHEKTAKLVADLSKNIGGMQNSFGQFVETMFSANLRSKFNELGYDFTRQTCNTRYTENDEKIAEVGVILENGEYILLVEVKTELRIEFVEYHLKRIEKIRKYMDNHHDARKIIGAVAGGVVPEDVLLYAQNNGLFVIVQSGDSSTIADMPKGF
ncbi:MAG: hypothetical protein LBI54_07315, partial [Lachnospiraceae bacterium]|nr:hypothetical protein [Lachnospiraceae bacterium]